MDIMSALKKVTSDIKNWTDDNKVAKVSGKGLSTNDYTTADRAKVQNIPNDLLILDGKLYLAQDGTPMDDSAVTLPSGGGGGSSATITLKNLLESSTITTALGGKAILKFSFESSETDENGTCYIYVGGNLKGTATIVFGVNEVDIGAYIGEGTNEVKITCSDIYSNSKSLSYVINTINLRITSTFDDSQIYSGDINVRYVPYGAIEKTIHFVVDDVDSTITVSETGKQQTYVIPGMEHGTHTLKLYATAIINDVEITSNILLFDIMCVSETGTAAMISSAYDITSITQGELVNIGFSVYDPVNMTAEITLTIKQGDTIYSTSSRTVDRTRQTWSTRDYPIGEVEFIITYGVINKSHIIAVAENNIDISVKETDLEFQLKAAGKSNSDNDRDVWSSGDVTTTFEYFNWDSTGWVNDENGDTALRLSGDSKAIINYTPFKSDARSTGRTIEINFAIRDVNNRNAIAISCLSGGIGFTVTADTAKLMSEQSEIFCNYTDEEKIKVAFVIEPKSDYRLMYVYLNGVLSGVKQYPETDNWQQQTPVNITVGSPYCSVDLYSIRSYNAALTMYEIRDNYIADITDVNEKLSIYTDNDIYDIYGDLSFSELKSRIPTLTITGDLPTYKGDKKKVTIVYNDPTNSSLSFESEATIDIQGTSSQWYRVKNYKTKTSDAHQLAADQIATKVFCFKADFAESTSTHNTGSANFINTLYETKIPPQEDDERVRSTVYGHPAVVFHKKDSASEPKFVGKYNANHDKSSEETFGFTSEYPDVQSVEFCNNTSDACLFHGPIPDDWSEDFEFRYPDGYEDINAFKEMHSWVVSTWQDGATGNPLEATYTDIDGIEYTSDTKEYRLAKFKTEFEDHFDMEFALVYYIFTFFSLMVDQRAKNLFLTTWDKVHWLAYFYDNDTIFGINNEGKLVFDYYHEDHDTLDTSNVYNGSTSALWVNFREAFSDKIQEKYKSWRSEGKLTLDKLEQAYITNQSDKWAISIYNEDSDYKYVDPVRTESDATNLYQVRGTGEEHLKYFLKNRFAYCDSKWNSGDYPNDYISLRIYTPSGELAVPANANITLTTFSDCYQGVKYRANGTLKQQRAKANVATTFEAPDETFNDTETACFPASQISSLGDLSPLYCGSLNVSKAQKLTELIIGSSIDGYSNPNLIDVSIGTNNLLQKIDVRNCPNLTEPLALANCPNIQEIYATGSGITGLELPSSGYLKKVYLPGTLTNLTVTNQQYIEEFDLEGYDNLTTLRIEKTVNIPVEDIMLNAPNLNRVRLLDVTWSAESEDALRQTIEKFKSCLGLDANGNNTDKAVVTGKVTVPSISDELFNDIYENFPNLVVDDGLGKPYILNYKDRDGNSLYVTRVTEGADAFDPIEKGYIETPATIETETYKYTFIGWSTLPTNISKHYIITAQYSTEFAIKYYSEDTLLYRQWAIQGASAIDPVADGLISAPTKEGTDDLHYIFSGWDNLPTNVQNATSVYAQFSNVYPTHFYATVDDITPYYTQWVIEGEDAHDPVAALECEAPSDIIISADEKQVFSAWDNIPTNVIEVVSVYATYDTYWAVRFYNETSLVDLQWVKDGESGQNPITRALNPIQTPTKDSTAQYNYTFSNWDGDYTNVTEARNIYATYNSTIRRYTVYFYNMDELLYTVENVQYGSSTSYSGSTPTKLGVDNPEDYIFTGWYPTPENIQGETRCNALFRFTGYLEDDWTTIAENVANGTATDLYPIGARKEIPITFSDGTSITADIELIEYNHDDLADDSGKATLTFFCKDLPDLYRKMADENTSGWEGSDMRTFTNGELYNSLPAELQAAIKPVYKIADGGSNNKALVTTVDKCWLASYEEVGLPTNSNIVSGQGEVYSSTFSSSNSSRIKYLSDGYTAERWWLRTSYYSMQSVLFYRVQTSGASYCDGPSYTYYVAFGFCI